MKNQLLFLAFFALLLISKAQNSPPGADKVVVIVLNQEENPDISAVVEAAIARANEEAVIIVPNQEEAIIVPNEEAVVVTLGEVEVASPIGESGNTPIEGVDVVAEEAIIANNEEADIVPAFPSSESPNYVINTTNTPGPTLTIQLPPIPINQTLSNADAAQNYLRSALALNSAGNSLVLITNPDGTISIVNSADLATLLALKSTYFENFNYGPVVVPDGGNVQFVRLNASFVASAQCCQRVQIFLPE